MFNQVKLRYAYDALEPHIDALTMETHYSKHYAAYTKNFNDALARLPGAEGKSLEQILSTLGSVNDPELRATLRNNGGGLYNHSLYFDTMSPNAGGTPTGKLKQRIDADFGSFQQFKEQISSAAAKRFGSGWAWLVTDKAGKLSVSSTPNQDNPIMDAGEYTPILGIDVWEHAYYLKYKNLRGDYVSAFFNVVDWDRVQQYYTKATE